MKTPTRSVADLVGVRAMMRGTLSLGLEQRLIKLGIDEDMKWTIPRLVVSSV
jgi:hypothetical protein